MAWLDVEVVTRVVGSMSHCSHCQVFIDGVGVGEQVHRRNVADYPEDLQREWDAVLDLMWRLAARFPGRLRFHITDAQSPRGLWLALRGVRRYPAFLVGRERVFGLDEARLSTLIAQQLAIQPAP